MTTTTIPAEKKIRRGLDEILDRFPFFSAIVARWKVSESSRVSTFATDGPNLFWNRSFVDQLSHRDVAWTILHEAGHVFLGHHVRIAKIDATPKAKNVGCDLALNDIIRSGAPERMVKFACFPGLGSYAHLPKDRDAEFYISQIGREAAQDEQDDGSDEPDEENEADKGGDDSDASEGDSGSDESESETESSENGSGGSESDSEGSGSESDSEGSESGSDASESDSGESESDEESSGSGSDASGSGEESSGSGEPSETNLDDLGTGDLGEVLPAPEAKEGEKSEEEAWRQVVSDGITAARIAGNLPGYIEQISSNLFASKKTIGWKELLRRFMQEVSKAQLSFARPNRRSAWRSDVILPTRHSRDSGKGCVLVDTSGSMSEDACNSALGEIEEILSAFQDASVTLLQCDTRLIEGERKFSKQDFPLKVPVSWLGRGGTDLTPALRKIALRRGEFSWLAVITDGFWSMDSVIDAGIPTIYVITPHGARSKARFGTTIRMDG
jgi:predicted metal-dependent peptidase